MTGKLPIVDYESCDPKACSRGKCPAALACPLNLLRQDEPFEPPMAHAFPCRACATCSHACPLETIELVTA